MNNKGLHVIADVYSREQINKKILISTIEKAIKTAQMTVIEFIEHDFGKEDAFTAMWLLQESHFTVHTYPELNYISIDCYTCGEKSKPVSAIAEVMESFNLYDSKMTIINRG
jgi:S-adenosylmethionine decarboxylase